MLKLFLLVISTSFISQAALAQLPVSLTLPQSSPFEERSITIGLTKINFEYSSVGIKGREIWGDLVPYGEVWRTGANRNTVFTVSDDIFINGEELRAGSYGLHTIPGENEWVLIFSNFSEAWGSYFYDESEDALRITVPAEKMDSKYEWMKFSFSDYTPTSVEISLKWAYRKIPFTVEVPKEVTFKNIEKQYKTLPAFGWQGWVQGANYTLNNEYRLDKGLEWAEKGLGIERNVQTVGTVGKLYILNNKKEKGFEYASELIQTWPDNWRSYYLAAEIYETAYENDRALEAYLKARDLAPDRNSKYVIQQRVDKLE